MVEVEKAVDETPVVYEEALDILFYSLRCNQCFAQVRVEKVNVGILFSGNKFSEGYLQSCY